MNARRSSRPTPPQPALVTPPPQPANGYYRVPEVARLLGVSKMHVYRLMTRGEIRYLQLGRARRISAAALAEYTAAHEHGVVGVSGNSVSGIGVSA